MIAMKVAEHFLNVTDFRGKLSELERFRVVKEGEEELRIEVVTERGKPVVTVMPYEAYERLRELILLLKVQANAPGGEAAMSFKAGTPVEEAIGAIMRRKKEEDGGKQKRGKPAKRVQLSR